MPEGTPSPLGLGSHPRASWGQELHPRPRGACGDMRDKGFCGQELGTKRVPGSVPGRQQHRQGLPTRGELSSGTLEAFLKGMLARGQALVAWGPPGPSRLPGAELCAANFHPVVRRLSPTPSSPSATQITGGGCPPPGALERAKDGEVAAWGPSTTGEGNVPVVLTLPRQLGHHLQCTEQTHTAQAGGGGLL